MEDQMTSQLGRKAKVLFAFALGIPLVLYVALASRLIGARVGYQYDEALYVESAVFLLHGVGAPPTASDRDRWLTTHGRRWPLMIIPYVGTTKSLVALPIFAALGITPATARYSGVVLGCVGIAGLVTLIATEVGPAAALIAGVLVAIHPSYLDLTVFDNGGVSVWMASMGLVASALTNHLRRQTKLSAFLLGVAGGIGVWARVNVLWLLASAIVAVLFVYGRRAVPRRDRGWSMAGGASCGALPLILYEIGSRMATVQYIANARQPLSASRFAERLRELAEVMIADGEQRVIWAGPPMPSWQVGLGAAVLGCVLVCVFLPIRHDSEISRSRRAFALTAVLLTGIMATSGLGVASHHLVAVLPLAVAALAILGFELFSGFRFAGPLLGVATAGFAVLLIGWDARIDRGLRETGGKRIWSSGVDDVRRYLRSHPVPSDRLKILNWGFQKNLYVGSGGAVYGTELFWRATSTRSSRQLSWPAEIADGGAFLLYLSPTGSPSLDAGAEGFSKALEEYRGPRRERRFFDRSGSAVARLVEIPATR
jgi:hypothetical protein